MKNFGILFLIVAATIGCTNNVRKESVVSNDGKVLIGENTCTVYKVNAGDAVPVLYFIDCPDSSSTIYKNGKSTPTSVSSKKNPLPQNETTEFCCH